MTLLIACILLANMQAPGWAYVGAAVLWINCVAVQFWLIHAAADHHARNS